MKRALRNPSFANLTSLLALFVALGGTSYALTLPRNSVGAAQIRTRGVGASEIRKGAVRSSEVRDRSLGVRELSLSARESLRGRTGAPGPTGPQGPSGVTYRAAVKSTGGLDRGNAISDDLRGTNEYLIGFGPSVGDCVSTATLAEVPSERMTPPAGRITVGTDGHDVVVRTFNAAGSPERLPFHLIVAC
jgi:hypothetical protein